MVLSTKTVKTIIEISFVFHIEKKRHTGLEYKKIMTQYKILVELSTK